MTHAEALAGNTVGLPPSPCPGELAKVDSFPDSRITREGPVTSTIEVYHCPACGMFLSMEAGRLLNCYHRPERAGQIVRDLADQLDARRGPADGP